MDDPTIRTLPDGIYFDIYRHLAERLGSASGDSSGFSWTASPFPVWGKACFALDLRTRGDAVLDALREKVLELGCFVATGPACRPGDAERRLEAAGFVRAREAAGMVLPRALFKPGIAPEGLSILPVSAPSDWLDWASIVCRNLFAKESGQDSADFAGIGAALSGGGRFRAFLGRDGDGRAVATSAAWKGALGSDGVFFVATEASSRRRGHGGALSSRASASCLDSGAEYVSLMATAAGRPVYEALGFIAVSTLGRYGLPASDRIPEETSLH